jgi:hypothetical protein
MAKQTGYASLRIPLKIKHHVEKVAEQERRSLSQMLGILIEEALIRRNGARLRGLKRDD